MILIIGYYVYIYMYKYIYILCANFPGADVCNFSILLHNTSLNHFSLDCLSNAYVASPLPQSLIIAASNQLTHGPLARYWNMHHDTYVTHVPWCMPGSLNSGFLWSQWRGKRSRHSRCIYIYICLHFRQYMTSILQKHINTWLQHSHHHLQFTTRTHNILTT